MEAIFRRQEFARMSHTPRLNLPFLAAGQAQKHVTLNESLLRLDALVQIRALSRTVTTPPSGAQEGDCYVVPASPSGAWTSHGGKLASFQDGGWNLLAPAEGWLVWVTDEATFQVRHNGNWVALPVSSEQVARWGINSTADNQNRLAVASPGSLFTHSGSSHRISVNKASASDTASVLFQRGYSGGG